MRRSLNHPIVVVVTRVTEDAVYVIRIDMVTTDRRSNRVCHRSRERFDSIFSRLIR
jgi:hypothetical protein